MATLLYQPHLAERFRGQPAWFVVPALTILAVANIPRELHLGREFRAFLSSGAAIGLLMSLVAIGLFPVIVFSDPHPERSLTIYNSASSDATLRTMLVVAAVGIAAGDRLHGDDLLDLPRQGPAGPTQLLAASGSRARHPTKPKRADPRGPARQVRSPYRWLTAS